MRARYLPAFMICSVLCIGTGNFAWAGSAEIEFFEKKIRPVLVKHCYECHSADANSVMGGLLLDDRKGMLAGGDSGPSLVPGKPQKSLLIESLKYESYEMPPSGKLPDKVIRDFEQWIQAGAHDPRKATARPKESKPEIDWQQAKDFWAYQRLQAEHNSSQSLTEQVDAHLNAALKREEIKPNSSAEPSRLIRRLYYDLTGLPPSPGQVLEFLNDPSEERWRETVDRLLASPQFGEQWGRHWLDVARYADSNGGDFNATHHNAWRYRNYVIEAYNNDKPFDEFMREQLAGDLLESKSDADRHENLVATGFLMIGPKMLSERDKEKLEFDVVDEQIDTVGKAFLGLSLGCARCHDHKFDPVPMSDYYALAGIFRSTQVLDGESQKYVSDWLRRELPTSDEHREALAQYEKTRTELSQAEKQKKKDVEQAKRKFRQFQEGMDVLTLDDTEADLTGDWTESTYSKGFIGKGYIHDNKQKDPVRKAVFKTTIKTDGDYRVRFGYLGSGGRDDRVPVTLRQGDSSETFYIDQTKPGPIRDLFFELGKFRYSSGDVVEVEISNKGTSGYVIVDAVQFIRLDNSEKSEQAQKRLAELQTNLETEQAELKSIQQKISRLEKDKPEPIPVAFAVRDREQTDDCEICIRGDHKKRGKTVPRGVLDVISREGNSDFEQLDGSGRLQLARWLSSDASALVSRVYVNRIWMHLFGEGLVRSVDNFGSQGQRPTHPELLDQLAYEFQQNGWSTKQLIRQLVLTEAYRRSTVNRPDGYRADPENRLLWRANRRPLSAEEIQDTMLALQRELDRQAAQSTVSNFGRLVVNNSSSSKKAEMSESYAGKRAIYHPVIRNQLTDLASLFDFANPAMVVGKRPQTNVPAQALYLMNNDQPRETARAIVDYLFEEHSRGSFSHFNDLYLMVYGRLPTQEDDQLAQNYIRTRTSGDVEGKVLESAWTDYVQAMLASTEFRYLD